MYAMTAAHKTLPLGTVLSVRNLSNGKTCTVRVNDRGPFVAGRIIDLSYSAAKALGVVGPGTAPVEIVATAPPPGTAGDNRNVYYRGDFTIQVGAFRQRDNAVRFRQKLAKKYKNAHIVTARIDGETFHRVRVGHCTSLAEAMEYERRLNSHGYAGAFVVAE